jgi:uncharacterized protein YndB with AHSA1/START domain
MNNELMAEVSLDIKAPAKQVWHALTDPVMVKEYLFGTQLISDWKTGSSIRWKGEWQGKSYTDKGTVLAIDPPKRLQYNYWSSMSKLEDKEENYSIITVTLSEHSGRTSLHLTQNHNATEESRKHSEENWKAVLNKMKEILETK